MSLVDSFNLENYETEEDLRYVLGDIRDEISTLYGYQRGVIQKLQKIEDNKEDSE